MALRAEGDEHVHDGDDLALPDTFTRSELLKLRGYDESVIAGTNGHRDNGGTESRSGLQTMDAPVPRLCAGGCGTVLEGPGSKRWCSEGCRQRHRRQHVPPVLPQEVTEAVAVDDSPSPPPAVSYDVLALVATIPAAMPAGWQLRASAEGVTLRWPAWSD